MEPRASRDQDQGSRRERDAIDHAQIVRAIDARRSDPAFQSRLESMLREERDVLDRLAADD